MSRNLTSIENRERSAEAVHIGTGDFPDARGLVLSLGRTCFLACSPIPSLQASYFLNQLSLFAAGGRGSEEIFGNHGGSFRAGDPDIS